MATLVGAIRILALPQVSDLDLYWPSPISSIGRCYGPLACRRVESNHDPLRSHFPNKPYGLQARTVAPIRIQGSPASHQLCVRDPCVIVYSHDP